MSDTSPSLSHARWHGTSHVVCVSKRRRQALFGHSRPALGPILHAWARQQDGRLIAGHGMPEHVPLCIEMPPQQAVASVSACRKGKSAIAIARPLRGRERPCPGAHGWARG
jgi:REP element-mobilizing transposase RayT